MEESRKLSGKDLITIGIFSAIYFVLNLATMITGFVPVLWYAVTGRDRNCDRNSIPAYGI